LLPYLDRLLHSKESVGVSWSRGSNGARGRGERERERRGGEKLQSLKKLRNIYATLLI